MPFLIGQILGVAANLLLAHLAAVGEDLLVTGNAMRLVFFQDVAMAHQGVLAAVTRQLFVA